MGGGVSSSAAAMVSAILGRLVAGVTISLSDVPRFNGCFLLVEAGTCKSGRTSFTLRFLGIEGLTFHDPNFKRTIASHGFKIWGFKILDFCNQIGGNHV